MNIKEVIQAEMDNTIDFINTALEGESKPCLAIIKANNDPASEIYVRNKINKATELGIEVKLYEMKPCFRDILFCIEELNKDKTVHGIILQLPTILDDLSEKILINAIDPKKDVDGLTNMAQANLWQDMDQITFEPATALACLGLMTKYFAQLGSSLEGKTVLVMGRSKLVGKPLIPLLNYKNSTPIWVHSKSNQEDVKELMDVADVIVVAVGKPHLINKDFWIPKKKSPLIIDVGINRVNGKVVGDVKAEDYPNLAVTPVPGGVGKLTVLHLLSNVTSASFYE